MEKDLANPVKRGERTKESRGAGVQQSHCWGQQRGTAEDDTRRSEVSNICDPQSRFFPSIFFSLELKIRLGSSLFEF